MWYLSAAFRANGEEGHGAEGEHSGVAQRDLHEEGAGAQEHRGGRERPEGMGAGKSPPSLESDGLEVDTKVGHA